MMYDTVDTVYDCIRIATGVMSTIKIRPERMLSGERGGDDAAIREGRFGMMSTPALEPY